MGILVLPGDADPPHLLPVRPGHLDTGDHRGGIGGGRAARCVDQGRHSPRIAGARARLRVRQDRRRHRGRTGGAGAPAGRRAIRARRAGAPPRHRAAKRAPAVARHRPARAGPGRRSARPGELCRDRGARRRSDGGRRGLLGRQRAVCPREAGARQAAPRIDRPARRKPDRRHLRRRRRSVGRGDTVGPGPPPKRRGRCPVSMRRASAPSC